MVQKEQGARRRGLEGKEQCQEMGKPRSQVPLIVNKNRGWVRELNAKKEDVQKDLADAVNDTEETKQRRGVDNGNKPNLKEPETKPLIIGSQNSEEGRIGIKNRPNISQKERDIQKHSNIELTIIENLEKLRDEKIKREEKCEINEERIHTRVTVPLTDERKSLRERYPKDMRNSSKEGKDDAQDKNPRSVELNKVKYLRNDKRHEKIEKAENSDDIEVGHGQERPELCKQQGSQSRRARKDSSVLRAISNSGSTHTLQWEINAVIKMKIIRLF